MFVDSMYQLGSKRSCIRELFEYGQQKARELGPEHVFDYSLGNPSVPVPAEAGKVIEELVECGPTSEIFSTPKDKRTEDYISGRFG